MSSTLSLGPLEDLSTLVLPKHVDSHAMTRHEVLSPQCSRMSLRHTPPGTHGCFRSSSILFLIYYYSWGKDIFENCL